MTQRFTLEQAKSLLNMLRIAGCGYGDDHVTMDALYNCILAKTQDGDGFTITMTPKAGAK